MCLCVRRMCNFVTRKVFQHVVLARHQDLGSEVRENGADERLRLSDHSQQILIHQKDLMVLLICRYLEQFVEIVKRGLFHSLHKLTSPVLSCTTQTKTLETVYNQ